MRLFRMLFTRLVGVVLSLFSRKVHERRPRRKLNDALIGDIITATAVHRKAITDSREPPRWKIWVAAAWNYIISRDPFDVNYWNVFESSTDRTPKKSDILKFKLVSKKVWLHFLAAINKRKAVLFRRDHVEFEGYQNQCTCVLTNAEMTVALADGLILPRTVKIGAIDPSLLAILILSDGSTIRPISRSTDTYEDIRALSNFFQRNMAHIHGLVHPSICLLDELGAFAVPSLELDTYEIGSELDYDYVFRYDSCEEAIANVLENSTVDRLVIRYVTTLLPSFLRGASCSHLIMEGSMWDYDVIRPSADIEGRLASFFTFNVGQDLFVNQNVRHLTLVVTKFMDDALESGRKNFDFGTVVMRLFEFFPGMRTIRITCSMEPTDYIKFPLAFSFVKCLSDSLGSVNLPDNARLEFDFDVSFSTPCSFSGIEPRPSQLLPRNFVLAVEDAGRLSRTGHGRINITADTQPAPNVVLFAQISLIYGATPIEDQ